MQEVKTTEDTQAEEYAQVEPQPASTRSKLTRRAFVKGVIVTVGGAGLALGGLRLPGAGAQATLGADAEKPTLYMVATAHIDSQWNWTVQHVIAHCIPATMRPNWELFEKYPAYTFNFEGTIHYQWFKEYHPEDWAELQSWVKKGRWKLSGSWVNAVDVCTPSPESLFRQALYGQQFFRREFGMVSRDIYLPDCFGFPYTLPSIGKHSGLQSFSTQKFALWGGWFPAPFSVGRWEGVDGSELVTALRPGSYNHDVRSNPASSPDWNSDLADAGGKKVDLRYFGTGDQGGTPGDSTVAFVQQGADDENGTVRVINTSADQMAKDLTPAQIAALPHYKGELTMKTHGVGGYTSQAAHKKWNRMNEQMADAAERAALAGAYLGGPAYPHDTLSQAWVRTLWNQFHDTLPGTCVPQAYTFTWNDDLLSLNQFSQVVTTGVAAMAQHLDTDVKGVPLVVYNPLDQPRTDAVEATVALPSGTQNVRVYDTITGREVPSQTLAANGTGMKIVFIASAPSVGSRVYDVRPSKSASSLKTSLSATAAGMESSRYKVAVTPSGDIGSVYDKAAKTELLQSASQLQHLHDSSPVWPAWEVLYETDHTPPEGVIADNIQIRVTEAGPARAALEVTRTLGETTWVQHIRLTPDGDWVEVHNDIDWQTPGTLVKAAFPMTASNPVATFDLGLGTIERPNSEPNRYEVNGQQWADLTDSKGDHGLAVLTKYKYGWDKPADNQLRLSLIRTPEGSNYPWQDTNDLGRHHFPYALAGHSGDWRTGKVVQKAARFNQPLMAFQTTKHKSIGGREFSLIQVSTDQVGVRGLKRAEDSGEIVVRVQELTGHPVSGAAISFASPVVSIREINAAEEAVGPYTAQNGKLVFNLTAYQPRSFAVTLASATQAITPPAGTPIVLPYNFGGITPRDTPKAAAFDSAGGSYPADLWPSSVTAQGIHFTLAGGAGNNMVSCSGQTVAIPAGSHNRLYLLAASANGDQSAGFTINTGWQEDHQNTTTLTVQDWAALTGQWYSRVLHNDPGDPATFGPGTGYPDPNWDGNLILAGMAVKSVRGGRVTHIENLKPGFVKRDPVAWVGSHRHNSDGILPYCFCYLFLYSLDLPAGAVSVTLPNNPNIRVMAMTAASTALADTQPAGVLYEPDPFPPVTPRTPPPTVKRLPAGTEVFSLAAVQTFDGNQSGIIQNAVPNLPVEGTDPWTINQFVYLTAQPDELTVLSGFGDGMDTGGEQRYLIKFHDGIHFWGSDIDVTTGVPFDLNKWQMVTLTFDGTTLNIYKNGAVIKTSPVTLNDAADIVKIGTTGPWNGNRIAGKIAGFGIWNSALDPAAVKALMAQMPQ